MRWSCINTRQLHHEATTTTSYPTITLFTNPNKKKIPKCQAESLGVVRRVPGAKMPRRRWSRTGADRPHPPVSCTLWCSQALGGWGFVRITRLAQKKLEIRWRNPPPSLKPFCFCVRKYSSAQTTWGRGAHQVFATPTLLWCDAAAPANFPAPAHTGQLPSGPMLNSWPAFIGSWANMFAMGSLMGSFMGCAPLHTAHSYAHRDGA